MKEFVSRRQFLAASAMATAGLALPKRLLGSKRKSLLIFTKSSGFEHDVVKQTGGRPSILEGAVTALGEQHGFDVTTSKDGKIFDSKDFRKYAALLFFTTGDLTTSGTDRNPPMTPQGKKALLDAVHNGLGFVGVHAASDTFHTQPDNPPDLSNRYVAHGKQSDPYLRMVGGEFIVHGSTPRLQTANLIVKDMKFPGLEAVASPVSFTEEWYSLKDFVPDLHVILTLDTQGMKGECYQRASYPVTWARMNGKGRVFYTAMGDRPENWSNPFFVSLLGGGIRWAIRDVNASLEENLTQAAPGYSEIPPKPPPKP
ncbi:MAG TPA: ThuA domain-containing protein [Terriglobales bacterium]|nr:ThuA domain-containing protein [Terriglobales bacterium]